MQIFLPSFFLEQHNTQVGVGLFFQWKVLDIYLPLKKKCLPFNLSKFATLVCWADESADQWTFIIFLTNCQRKSLWSKLKLFYFIEHNMCVPNTPFKKVTKYFFVIFLLLLSHKRVKRHLMISMIHTSYCTIIVHNNLWFLYYVQCWSEKHLFIFPFYS